VAATLLKDGEAKARHDPEVLARLIISLSRGIARNEEIFCGGWAAPKVA
jgi:hypothetical protein